MAHRPSLTLKQPRSLTPFVTRIAIPNKSLTTHLRPIENETQSPLINALEIIAIVEIPRQSLARLLVFHRLSTPHNRRRPPLHRRERCTRARFYEADESSVSVCSHRIGGLVAAERKEATRASNPAIFGRGGTIFVRHIGLVGLQQVKQNLLLQTINALKRG